MIVRHQTCIARLFDSRIKLSVVDGRSADLAVRCSRCSKDRPTTVFYRVDLPRWVVPGRRESQPVLCQNIHCLSRLCDLSLPYKQIDSDGDISIKCHRCKLITHLLLTGVAETFRI